MSLFVLDTDIVSLYQHNHPLVSQHLNAHAPKDVAITVITVEEQLSGWYARLRQARSPDKVAVAYEQLAKIVQSLARLPILLFPEAAILRYEGLLALKVNVRKMDLRIAAIALENSGIVVTRNLRDFQRVPGLAVVDWSV
jgi:tRNA(fMet)-specific endonuclease VapC